MAKEVIHMSANIIPTLKYRNALQMIDWLGRAFGFEKHAVYADGETVHHAQLTLGAGMIMLGSASDDEFGRMQTPPAGVDAPVTQSAYIIVADADAHHTRSVAAGARVVRALADEDYGGRGYTCRDPEGHLWSFGTYDPWKEETAKSGT
jgi:uncharacterized glyoxalase superfamily protein PhnB